MTRKLENAGLYLTQRARGAILHAAGFTLAEMAIVLFIVVLLLGGLLVPLSAQVQVRKISETRETLLTIQEALLGFSAANGRLPCPAQGGTTGVESLSGTSTCSHAYDGFVPGITLGLTPTNSAGYVVDAWNQPIRYAVTTSNASAFTTSNGMKAVGISALSPDLIICSDAFACTTKLATTAVAVIFSQGANSTVAPTGADELENINGDATFVSHEPTAAGSANGEFDDIVTWLSPNILYNRMIAAGRLP